MALLHSITPPQLHFWSSTRTFALNEIDFALNEINFALKEINFALKEINFPPPPQVHRGCTTSPNDRGGRPP